MHVNMRSLLPKFTALAHSANPDVLAVSESWLRKTTKNSEISIPYYNIFRQDRTVWQSTSKILSYYPGLYPNNWNFYS